LEGTSNGAVPRQEAVAGGPSAGHACGHNVIGAGALGAALAIADQIDQGAVTGSIKVFGCPDEELLGGKTRLAAPGAFDALAAALHSRVGAGGAGPIGAQTAASYGCTITFRGRAAHAGMAPWDGRSALHAAELFGHAVNLMREHQLPTARIHYAIRPPTTPA